MSATLDFYLARAAESAKAAQDAELVNVRERCLRAEAAWREMADRTLRVEAKRQKDASIKAAQAEQPGPWR